MNRDSRQPTLPNNGVAITRRTTSAPEHRTYEVYQRERVGQSTEKIQPADLLGADQLIAPFDNLATLREAYPCYRDWVGNVYWLTRYDDVTSVFADRANFAAPSRAELCGLRGAHDLAHTKAAHSLWGDLIDNTLPGVIARTLDALPTIPQPDLALDYANRLASELQRLALGLAEDQQDTFDTLMWQAQRADSSQPQVAERGRQAISNLLDLIAGRASPLAEACPEASDADLLATLLGFEARTFFAGTVNLLHAWLTNPQTRQTLMGSHRAMKIACLETLRYAPPVPFAQLRARHEVERFGRLLPAGAVLRLSALAANRDPRQFASPERFIVDRTDLCHREARGQFRADGLATAVSFGTGLPSKHPAVPEDRPRSIYALTRDAIVLANEQLLERYPDVAPSQSSELVAPRSIDLFGTWAAWALPIEPCR